jgi:hypothetical protein
MNTQPEIGLASTEPQYARTPFTRSECSYTPHGYPDEAGEL